MTRPLATLLLAIGLLAAPALTKAQEKKPMIRIARIVIDSNRLDVDEAAYHAHVQTPHFLKYKETTRDMVKSLELVDAIPIALQSKPRP